MSEKINSYKDLLVWQKSRVLVKDIYLLMKQMPDDEKFGLTSQIKRAAVSVPSNIAEGWGRGTRKQFINGLVISRGSLLELETQIILTQDLGLIDNWDNLQQRIEEISRMLNALIDKLQQKENITVQTSH